MSYCVVWEGGLVGVPLLLELHVSKHKDGGDDSEDGVEVVIGDAHDLHGGDSVPELLRIVRTGDAEPALRHKRVVFGIVQQEVS